MRLDPGLVRALARTRAAQPAQFSALGSGRRRPWRPPLRLVGVLERTTVRPA